MPIAAGCGGGGIFSYASWSSARRSNGIRRSSTYNQHKNMSGVRIRLARHGVANRPFYHLVAIPAQKARNGHPLEKLGEYDPTPRIRIAGTPARKLIEWDKQRIDYWLSVGALPTQPVTRLLMRVGGMCRVFSRLISILQGGILSENNKYLKKPSSQPKLPRSYSDPSPIPNNSSSTSN